MFFADLLKVDKNGVPRGDVQPLATGNVWSRLVASMLLARVADQLGTWFLTQVVNVRQYGVSVKDGLAKCIHSLRLSLSSSVESVYIVPVTGTRVSEAMVFSLRGQICQGHHCALL